MAEEIDDAQVSKPDDFRFLAEVRLLRDLIVRLLLPSTVLVPDCGRSLLMLGLALRLPVLVDMDESEPWSSEPSLPARASWSTFTANPCTTAFSDFGKKLGRGTGPGSIKGNLSEMNLQLHKLLCSSHTHNRNVVHREEP